MARKQTAAADEDFFGDLAASGSDVVRETAPTATQAAMERALVASPPMSLAEKAEYLSALNPTVQACRKCPLGFTRLQAVLGVGNPDSDLMLIGEAPGANEDKQGEPFVGNAGKLLTATLAEHGISRSDIYLSNIIKCRPPENRDPTPAEIAACEPYLLDQIRVIQPKLLCALGRYAAQVLLGHTIKIMQIHGRWGQYHGIPMLVCLHPAAVLHNPFNRDLFAQDIRELVRAYSKRHDRLPEVEKL